MSLWLVAILALHSGVAKTLSPSTPAVPGQNEQEASETGAEVGKLGELLPQDPGGDAQSNYEVEVENKLDQILSSASGGASQSSDSAPSGGGSPAAVMDSTDEAEATPPRPVQSATGQVEQTDGQMSPTGAVQADAARATAQKAPMEDAIANSESDGESGGESVEESPPMEEAATAANDAEFEVVGNSSSSDSPLSGEGAHVVVREEDTRQIGQIEKVKPPGGEVGQVLDQVLPSGSGGNSLTSDSPHAVTEEGPKDPEDPGSGTGSGGSVSVGSGPGPGAILEALSNN
jgi:hypothetical protein